MTMKCGLLTSSILVNSERKRRNKTLSTMSDCINEQDKFVYSLAKELSQKLDRKFKVFGPFGLSRKNTVLFFDEKNNTTTQLSVLANLKENKLSCAINDGPYIEVDSFGSLQNMFDFAYERILLVS